MRFEKQVAIVTGAGRGIGHAIAVRLANEGAQVACVSQAKRSSAHRRDQRGPSHAARFYAVDVSDHEAVQPVGARILEELGGSISWLTTPE